MRRTADTLIPARFLLTTAHFLASIMVYTTRSAYITAALPLSTTSPTSPLYKTYETSLMTALALSWSCFLVQYFGLFGGFTTFNGRLGSLYIATHFIATVTLSYFITSGWHYIVYWYIFGVCIAVPTLIEVGLIARVLLFRVNTL